jgi:predicted DNA-binding transcriptional regulator AlpA
LSKTFSRPKAAAKKLGLPLSSFYEKMAHDPAFPKAVALGAKAVAFDDDELLRSQLGRIAKRDRIPANQLERWIAEKIVEERALAERTAEHRAKTE